MGHQTAPRKTESRDWGLILLVMSIFLFIATLFYEGNEGDTSSASYSQSNELGESQDPSRLLNKINSNLRDTALKEEISRQAVDTESSTATSLEGPSADPYSGELPLPLSLDQEGIAKQVLKDTESRKREVGRPLTPDQRISAELQKNIWLNEERKRREEEYVKTFLENARKKGVNVRLNKDLDVTGINTFPVEQPIRIPQSETASPK